MTAKTYTSQFWIGSVESEERFCDFIGEDDSYFDDDNVPLSRFIASQGETWYDHDVFEAGYCAEAGSVLEKFGQYSYAEKWASLIEVEMVAHNIPSINAFVMIQIDEFPNRPPRRQVKNPCGCKGEGINLVYIGEITYDDYDD